MHRFAEISEVVLSGRASEEEQEEWFRQNGPDAPGLIHHLQAEGATYERILFWSFRYAETYFGLPHVADRAVLVPTAEQDPIVRLDVLATFFSRPSAFIFLTPEEQALVTRRAMRPLEPSCVVGSGLEPVARRTGVELELDRLGIRTPFILYLGRVDPNKGCEVLFRHFQRYHTEHPSSLQLVLAGPANMPFPHHPSVKSLGRVDDRLREALLDRKSVV